MAARKKARVDPLSDWSPSSWQDLPIKQQPEYKDAQAVKSALDNIRRLPPLVHPGEVDKLKAMLAECGRGERFLLQGGDCAELFSYCNGSHIENKLKILLQMSLVLIWGSRMPVVRVARIAGQYGKPRSKPTEVVDGVEVPSYKGDVVNGRDLSEREPEPSRMVQAYFHAAATLNYVRALVGGGFANLAHPEQWSLEHVQNEETRKVYANICSRMLDSLNFMETIDSASSQALASCDFFSSHEALLLNYEEALTRSVGANYYNVGAHFLWIGDRTRQLDGAHVEYFRGLANPIGIKVGPTMESGELVTLIDRLDPNREPGRITLITRFGKDKVRDHLPKHIRAVKAAGLAPVWCCDPMHGNTRSTDSGVKTRHFEDILAELRETFTVHKECGSKLNGVHFELTGDPVTECLGGASNLSESDLSKCYETFCDPRLNYQQSLDMALMIANDYQRGSVE